MSDVIKSDSILDRIAGHRSLLEETRGTWPAKRRLAGAVRDLTDCICATGANEDELLAAAQQIEAQAHRFAAQPRMVNPPGAAEMVPVSDQREHLDRPS
jgi:hypothetical protein